jgi:hypothetical protein
MFKQISLLVILWAVSLPILAEQLEMIVFLNKATNVSKEEAWPAYPGELKYSKKLHSSNPEINIIEDSNLYLNSIYSKLKISPNFQPIYRIGWRQSIGSSKKPLHFKFSCPDGSCSGNGIIDVQRMGGHVYKAKLDIILSHRSLKNTSGVRLQHVAKIKSNELYYFDHPVFGVLINIS